MSTNLFYDFNMNLIGEFYSEKVMQTSEMTWHN